MQNIKLSKTFIFLAILVLIVLLHPTANATAASSKIFFAYGFGGGSDAQWTSSNAYQIVNIISGNTIQWPKEFFTSKGIAYFFHASGIPSTNDNCSDINVCASQLLNNFVTSYNRGYGGISIDEFIFAPDTSPKKNVMMAQKKALEDFRRDYPAAKIMVWGQGVAVWYGGAGTACELLKTINQNADYYGQEWYKSEKVVSPNTTVETGLSPDNLDTNLNLLETCAPGILDKTLLTLGVSETVDYTYNLDPQIEYKELLNYQFYLARNSVFYGRLKGIGIYTYFRTSVDILNWIHNLYDHYFIKENSSYFVPPGFPQPGGTSREALKQMYILQSLKGGGFETGANYWTINNGIGSNARIISYPEMASLGIPIKIAGTNVPFPQIEYYFLTACSSPLYGAGLLLDKNNGAGSNISQTAAVLPNTDYVLTVYGKNLTSPSLLADFNVEIKKLNGQNLPISQGNIIKTLENPFFYSWARCADYASYDYRFTQLKMTFRTDGDTSLVFSLTDQSALTNNKVILDFVQLEPAKNIPFNLPPTSTPAPAAKATLNFKIKFQGISGNNTSAKEVNITLKQGTLLIGGFNNVAVTNINDGSGKYQGGINNIDFGAYDIFIKGFSHLQRKFAGVILSSGNNDLDWSNTTLLAGDLDNDNWLRINDVSSILSKYVVLSAPVTVGTGNYDLNADNIIDIRDISLILANYIRLETEGEK